MVRTLVSAYDSVISYGPYQLEFACILLYKLQ